MSYDLAIWYSPERITSRQAQEIYESLCREDTGALLPSKKISDFILSLSQRYPSLNRLPESDFEDSPWSADFNLSDRHVLLCIRYSRVDDMIPVIDELTVKYGLIYYNPQGNFVIYPPELESVPHSRLILGRGAIVDDPTSEEIEKSLSTLDKERNAFAVLERSDLQFIQAGFDDAGEFILEYRDGLPHYRYGGNRLSIQEIIKAFQAYARKEERQINDLNWQRL